MIPVLIAVLFTPLLICWGLWLLFSILSVAPSRRPSEAELASAPTIDILIPAHNEELLLPRLLVSLREQTGVFKLGRTLVIADHCDDSTSSLARQAGAEVLERFNGPRGKPAALRDGLARLADNTALPEDQRAVLILDADCTVSPNLLAEITAAMARGQRVVQAAYLLDCGDSQRLHVPAMIAFALKNVIRPRGMARLGLPTQLFGTGMCFRADILNRITFADHLTEDLAISHDLLLAGAAPRFVPEASVHSPLPAERNAMSTQKLRWETGQLATWKTLPAKFARLLLRGRVPSAIALIDWSAPPLAMAVMYWFFATCATTLLVTRHWSSPGLLLLPALSLACLAGYILIGGIQVAGAKGVARLFLGIPRFFFWKLALYTRMLLGKGAKTWDRTPRTPVPQTPVPIGANGSYIPYRTVIPIPATQTRLLGMPLHAITEAQALQAIDDRLSRGIGTWVVTPNLDILRQYCQNPRVRPLFHTHEGGADLLLADGMPLVWASRIAGKPVPERVPGSGIVLSLAELAARKKWRIFLLGGSPGAADRAAAVLQARYRDIQIAGACCPELGFDQDPRKMTALRDQLRDARPDIVYVALGFPKQERVIQSLRTALPNATFIGVGISLSFISGEIKRAPRFIQRAGLEWAHRLMQEPRRLAKRYLVNDLPFAFLYLFPRAVAARWARPQPLPVVDRHLALVGVPRPMDRPNPADDFDTRTLRAEDRMMRRRPGHVADAAEARRADASRSRQPQDRVNT